MLPKDAADHLRHQIAYVPAGIDEVIESLCQVHSEHAKAWKLEDEIKVTLARGETCFFFQLSFFFSSYVVLVLFFNTLFVLVCWDFADHVEAIIAPQEVVDPGETGWFWFCQSKGFMDDPSHCFSTVSWCSH